MSGRMRGRAPDARGASGAGRASVVVVGSGIAGLTTALRAAATGCRVTIVTKGAIDDGSTRFAQGGIAGVMFDEDRTADHAHDTIVAGAGLSDRDAVLTLVEDGPERIRNLVEAGVAFDREPDGTYVRGLEAAHSYPRILHAGGDATGLAIERALVARVREAEARGELAVLEGAFLVDVVVADSPTVRPARGPASPRLPELARTRSELVEGSRTPTSEPLRATGVELLVDGTGRALAADAVVLATGGVGQLYAHTTNPPVATGDGIAAALRAGADVADLEFVQFHPTVLPAEVRGGGEAVAPFLVSEAVRGEGAVLLDERGRRFAFDAHPDGELAPRDVVARAIGERMSAQQGRPVLLDATRLGGADGAAEFLARRFPTIDRAARERGLDWASTPIPVTPAAHYVMGGVATDLHGRTSLPGLYAVGETARTGVHGANRLASNSLLEGAVFGARAADAIVADAARQPDSARKSSAARKSGAARQAGAVRAAHASRATLEGRAGDHAANVPARIQVPAASVAPPFSRAALQQLMWECAGLERDADGLRRAAAQLDAWRDATAPR
ncbi:MAG: L-aspartate oxidase, partial [Pseudoclavibacter sp.]